jgi:hypothetical protein
MALAALSTNKLLQQVKGRVGEADYIAVVPMRPDQGYVSLVSFLISSSFLLPFSSASHPPPPFRRGCGVTEPPDLRS